jgi:ubiquinone/menaquinone biosynthesis C-methylase UbiE
MAALVTGPRVLDLGVGPGTSALEMARAAAAHRHVGLDRAGPMLRLAQAAARAAGVPLPLVQADALALPFAPASFDGATGHSFLYLLSDPTAALLELRRVLRPGGVVVFLEPHAGRASLGGALRQGPRCALSMVMWRSMARLHRRFDAGGLEGLLRAGGFEDARARPVLDGYGLLVAAVNPAGVR